MSQSQSESLLLLPSPPGCQTFSGGRSRPVTTPTPASYLSLTLAYKAQLWPDLLSWETCRGLHHDLTGMELGLPVLSAAQIRGLTPLHICPLPDT